MCNAVFDDFLHMIFHTISGRKDFCYEQIIFGVNVLILVSFPMQRELMRDPKASPEAALKVILASLSLPASMPLARLGIFRWAQQVAVTDVNHPLLPLLFQRFFAGNNVSYHSILLK